MKKFDLELSATSDLLVKVRNLAITAVADLIVKSVRSASVISNILVEKEFSKTYEADLRQKNVIPLGYSMDAVQKRQFVSQWELSLYAKRYDIALEYLARLAALKAMDVSYELNVRLIPQLWAVLVADALLLRTIKLSYLVKGLLFGSADGCYRTDFILSDRPTEHRRRRRLPVTKEVPKGVVEIHGDSFDYVPATSWFRPIKK